jgi:hypothetical protein
MNTDLVRYFGEFRSLPASTSVQVTLAANGTGLRRTTPTQVLVGVPPASPPRPQVT